MGKRISEIAKEMNVKSKDLILWAEAAGITGKTASSNLSEEELEKVQAERARKREQAEKSKAHAPLHPAGRPGIGVRPGSGARPGLRARSSTSAGRRPLPIGKAIVDDAYLSNKDRHKAEAQPVKAEKAADAAQVPTKEEPAASSQMTEGVNPVARKAESAPATETKTETERRTETASVKSAAAGEESASVTAAPKKKTEKQVADRKAQTAAGAERKTHTAAPQKESVKVSAENTATIPVTEEAGGNKKTQEPRGKFAQTANTAAAPVKERKTHVKASKPSALKAATGTEGKPAGKTERKPAAQGKPQADKKTEERTPAKTEAPRRSGLKIIARASEVEAARKAREEKARLARTERAAAGGATRRGERRIPKSARDARGGAAQHATGVRRRPGQGTSGGAAQNEHRRSSGNAARPAFAKGGSGRKSGGRYVKDSHDKYDKLERKSLEKQIRNKHTDYKKNVEPQETVAEEVLPEGTFLINVPITVAGFSEQTEVSTSQVIMSLMKLGIMANINQTIDEETVLVLADELGIKVQIDTVTEETEEEGLEIFEDQEKDLKPRPPVITVMGHVDHGKTSLLDAIRKTNVTARESGGITQHIGASEVRINDKRIVFLDTPGHEAFTAMRARGAQVTDIAVLVVAADDGVMPQTIESISHAKAAGVPIIVAINKMDKPGANPDRVKKELADHGVLVEDWGGEVISVPVSAKTGDGIVNLLEMILLQAEVLELKANPNRLALGTVIEARLDKSKGPVATLLVMNGTLKSGESIVAGTSAGRIRLMTDYKGKTIKKALPATAVEVLGLDDVPQAGDEFNAVKEDRIARNIAEKRKEKLRAEVLAKNSSMSLEKLFSKIQEGEVKELNLIIKADVQGSVGAMISSLEKLNNDEVKVNIIHSGVGTVTESDVMLAGTTGSVILGFNVRPGTPVQSMADRDGVEIRTYRVIYDVLDDVENAMKGMLAPEFKEELLGKVEIRTTFKVPNVGIIGGAYVTEGKVLRNAQVRLVRDGIVIHEGKISSLRRYKDDVREVAQGYECGIGIENYNDIKEGDLIECFRMVEIKRQ